MKKVLLMSVLITAGIVVCSCGQKKPNTASGTGNITAKKTDSPATISNGPANGTYNASGTISFTAGGADYSCTISKVIAASTSITIQTSTADVKTNGSLVITCYTATSAVNTGTYTAASSETISSVTFIDKAVTPHTATAATPGSDCTVNITALTSTSIIGTFTATVLTPIDKSSLSITNGVIDCTITSN
jgi:hypothetical protein